MNRLESAVHRGGLKALAIGLATLLSNPSDATALDNRRYTQWSNESALTVAPGRLELSLLQPGAFGLSRSWELRAHPLAFLVLPHLSAKARLLDGGALQISSLHSVSYPSLFLNLLAREGTGGLLPPTTEVPQSLLLTNSILISVEPIDHQWLTVTLGATTAPRLGDLDTQLDFPFLYQRFAALQSTLTPEARLTLTGHLTTELGYELQATQYWLWLNDEPARSSLEFSGQLGWSIAGRHRLSVATKVSDTQFPVGRRVHWLPYLDYSMRF